MFSRVFHRASARVVRELNRFKRLFRRGLIIIKPLCVRKLCILRNFDWEFCWKENGREYLKSRSSDQQWYHMRVCLFLSFWSQNPSTFMSNTTKLYKRFPMFKKSVSFSPRYSKKYLLCFFQSSRSANWCPFTPTTARNVDNNRLTGSIPSHVGQMSALTSWWVIKQFL